ncbi:hypothetical protein RvY_11104 [Ramazzottius varieornatus]|uniref:Uncharacterized protein n=1 Tax=Ramazzottius varieornatus TaxID=947166 RepID=A0A1D1VF30_RAMVA|nr:hypothetical protein RvY_11104 [Ramazzottius varieornatus]
MVETEEPTYSYMFSLFKPAIIVSYLHTLLIWKVPSICESAWLNDDVAREERYSGPYGGQ